ncbi:H-NS histone family protein [Phaeovulum sp.]|jgi:DNA-binding protein H-NS|uniref:H-NS histone family protein n=1 Tax=Phaeovulum sp. TaxID=2934796 RepID=UPI0027307645|nr:H-NS histone family protein [Phaeovulum sp.]MDP1669158.1 H-NS histone family protein [Phaeovulum sp.]MDP2062178.1 H-NS histone family protein [Phaeovulum sp.]MDP3862812.1 H-NS histone family protein [Phaeovulum sp.]MDZ4117797.1 H-NS histone family protein [Phaeovulum sp.]
MQIDLESLSLKDLKDLRARIDRAISGFDDRKKKAALAELEETARKLGYTLAELTALTSTRKRKPAAPKYANPADRSDTWSGRGRRPRWVVAALAAGQSLEDLAI